MARKTVDIDVTDFVQALGQLLRRLRALGGSQQLSWTAAIVLKRLDKDGPATAAALAREIGVKPQSMGSTLAALQGLGLVERTPHPHDGRQVTIALSAKGVAERKSSTDAKRSWLTQAVAGLDEGEQETLFAAGRIMRRLGEA